MVNLQELCNRTRDAAHWSVYIVDHFRMFNLDSGIRLYRNFLSHMQWILRELLQNAGELQAAGISIEPDYAAGILRGLLAAQEQKDYVLLADLIDMQVYPFLTELLNLLRQVRLLSACPEGGQVPGNADIQIHTEYLEANLKALQMKDAVLAAKLRAHTLVMEKAKTCLPAEAAECYEVTRTEDGQKVCYRIEATSVGHPTCMIQCEGQQYYLHSNKEPFAEADRWTSDVMDETCKAYHVLGGGLGYHGVRMYWGLYGNYPVHVYEYDLNMLWLSVKYCQMEQAILGKFFLHYDPQLRQLAEAVGAQEHRLCIHYPSLRRIGKAQLREHYERFFIQDSSYRNAKRLLQGNFDANISGMEKEPERIGMVDCLKEQFSKKNVFIVAAGPSLDKNVAMVKEVTEREDCLILATGTVLRKLLRMGIRPDYVIVTEPNERALAQINGAEGADVPMLMLSTANHGYMLRYPAKHYVIFQEGYPRAEAAAALLKTTLYQTGGSVSTTALDVALRLGAAKVVFLGLDLAFTDNLAHAEGTSNRIATDTEELIPVRAQNGGTVYADHKFIMYRKWMEHRLCETDVQKGSVINATEGGSYIEGMRHMTLAEVLWEL